MYRFDDSFLESVGLQEIPADKKQAFLDYAQDQLEIRIGEKMSEGMSEEQLDEFERIIDNDQPTIEKWAAQVGDYKNDEIYKKLQEGLGDSSEDEVFNNYLTAIWLNRNCPNYQTIIKDTVEALRQEISANKDALLASM